MRRFLIAGAAALAMLGVGLSSAQAAPVHARPAAHHHGIRPHNIPNGGDQTFYNENWGIGSICARISGPQGGAPEGYLIMGTGSCTKFFADFNCTDCFNSWIFRESANHSQCLYFDSSGNRDFTGNSYDLGTCDGTKSADIWISSSSNNWSQWINGGTSGGNKSLWCQGTGVNNPCYSDGQNGTDAHDHWQAA